LEGRRSVNSAALGCRREDAGDAPAIDRLTAYAVELLDDLLLTETFAGEFNRPDLFGLDGLPETRHRSTFRVTTLGNYGPS
jgi:hypothetical protein